MPDDELLEATTGTHVRTLTLNRPAQLNALDHGLAARLLEALLDAEEDDDCRAIVLTGAGRGFCSGFDVRALAAAAGGDAASSPAVARAVTRGVSTRLARALVDLETPMVAAVNGPCAGAGVSLALACDIVLAGDDASFAVSFARRGLVPDYGLSWLLPRLVGLRRARELCLLGDTLSAAQADDLGLLTRVVSQVTLMDEAQAVAGRLAAGAGVALGFTKRLLADSFDVDRHTAIDREFTAQSVCFASADAREGAAAFFERREPRFTGR